MTEKNLTLEQNIMLHQAEFNHMDSGEGKITHQERPPGSILPFMEDPQEQMLKIIYNEIKEIHLSVNELCYLKQERDLFAEKVNFLSDEITKLKEENVNLKNKIFFLEEEKKTEAHIAIKPLDINMKDVTEIIKNKKRGRPKK
jgi:hypothetical protein